MTLLNTKSCINLGIIIPILALILGFVKYFRAMVLLPADEEGRVGIRILNINLD